jgi:predicted RNA-binding protein with PIN domain
MRVTLVFDGRGTELTFDQPSGQPTFAHVHTPTGTTADEVIIQLVRQSRDPGDCVVASDDRGEREAIEALGAAGLAAADLAGWVQRAAQRQQSQLRERQADNEKKWRRPGSRNPDPS